MTDERWLRDALRRAASEAPARDRAGAALALVTRRRRQRVVAVSCTAAVAVVAAAVVTGGGAATTGLEPVATAPATTTAPEPTASPVTTPSPERSETPSPATASPTGRPAATPSTTTAPVAPPERSPAPSSPAPAPAFDVYFLVDATGSMHPHDATMRTAVTDVAERLGEVTTLRHGFATFRDIVVNEDGTQYGDPVYERIAAVRANGGRLPKLDYGGGGDDPEAHTVGLRSAIGRADAPWTDGKTPAGFGEDANRIVVLVTNAEVNRGDQHPTIAETVADLNAAGVAVATLLLPPVANDDTVRSDMAEFAEGTGAVAARDADCDGDGRIDLRRGDPLVCDVNSSGGYAGFADALVARFRTAS
ncbi:MAG TPA: vWA domain-containing protein [Frankiaceae bacterium]|nr:vWA domain-containing protein [Frankiaceae bacterium]